jgi:hypothetical protein
MGGSYMALRRIALHPIIRAEEFSKKQPESRVSFSLLAYTAYSSALTMVAVFSVNFYQTAQNHMTEYSTFLILKHLVTRL